MIEDTRITVHVWRAAFRHRSVLRALLRVAVIVLIVAGCADRQPPAPHDAPPAASPRAAADHDQASAADERSDERRAMVRTQIAARGITDERVLEAMGRVPRHRFMPEAVRALAYADRPAPIGLEQTISQPYIVAFMSQALALEGDEKVLEIGTGSGYQAAILAELAREVYSIEIVPELARRAKETLAREGYERVHLRTGDGYRGWPEAAPFDAIMLTAAPDHVPEPLIEQLAVGGHMILPVGAGNQELVVLTKTEAGIERRTLAPVRFVPMTGEAQEGRDRP